MKRLLVLLCAAAVLLASISSCATDRVVKRDCQGNKHYRLKNGIYI